MDSVNKTLYIPLYGKAFVSTKDIIIKDPKAEEIWSKEGFELKGKSKSKWLAYYMAIRAAVYDEWLENEMKSSLDAVVLHIGCGMDSRIARVSSKNKQWYDIDFPDVIEERGKYYEETEYYHMLAMDMRTDEWKKHIEAKQKAIVVLEGVSMYFKPEELQGLLLNLSEYFNSISILMDCYTEKAAKLSRFKNPINEVGVTTVYGYDNPQELSGRSELIFLNEYNMTPQRYIDELHGTERMVFKKLFAGIIARLMYKMYGYKKV